MSTGHHGSVTMAPVAPTPVTELREFPIDNPELQALLEKLFCVRHIERNEVLFRQGEPATHLFFVLKGRVVLERSDVHGHSSILCLRRPGDFFCPLSLFDRHGRYIGTARALQPSVVLVASREHFNQVAHEHPEIWDWLHRQCFAQFHRLMDRFNIALHHTVEERLAWLLWREACQQEDGEDGDAPVDVHLTQQELAGWVGTSRETVSRILQRWKRQGWIEVHRGRLRIVQPQALRQVFEQATEPGR